MKKLCLSLLFAAISVMGLAQVNLREGIVVTLEGDTLHGSIDYRTDEINSEQCYFIQDGQQEVVVYHPQDIAGYRFLDNGRYYVSRTVRDEKKKREVTLFLEFVLQGQLSLYRLNDEDYYVQGPEGELKLFHPIQLGEESYQRRQRLKWALYYTKDSESTQKMFWEKCNTGSQITKTFQHYNKEVCPDGDCEVFEYRAKIQPKEDRSFYPYVMMGSEWGIAYSHYDDNRKLHYASPVLTVGGNFYLKRLSKGLYFDFNLTCRHYQDEYYIAQYDRYYKEDCNDYSLFYGFGYQWKQYEFQPRIYAGSNISADSYQQLGDGFQFGVGLVYPIRRGALLLDVNGSIMHYDIYPDVIYGFGGFETKMSRLSLSLGYQF